MDHHSYASPFSWRYGRPELRALFSEQRRRRLWRAVWIALAESQAEQGLVTQAELDDLRAHGDDIDIEAALAIEREIGHDLMAEIRVFASQQRDRRRKDPSRRDLDGHRGHGRDLSAAARAAAAAGVARRAAGRLRLQIERYADLVCMGYTHLQPAEPTTVGYRLAMLCARPADGPRGLVLVLHTSHREGIRGAVGTSASYTPAARRRNGRTAEQQEADVLGAFELEARDVARKPIHASSTTCYSRNWRASAHRSPSSRPTCAFKSAGLRRDVRTVRRPSKSAARRCRLQAQSGDVGAHRFARAVAAGLCRRRVAERRNEFPRTHARRQREPAHDPARGVPLRRRDPLARAQGSSKACASTSARSPRTSARTAPSPAAKRC